jgi:hypothetical protein
MGHKSTHVTETVYRHVIAPAIRGDATVMDSVFDTPMAPRARPLPGLVRPDVYVVAPRSKRGVLVMTAKFERRSLSARIDFP